MLYVQYPSWISPEIVPFLPVRWYGLMYVLGFLTCYLYILAQNKKEGDTQLEEHLPNLFMWAFLGMFIGARLISELVYSRNFGIFIHPWELVWPFQDGVFTGLRGMSYHGGLVGIVIALLIYCRLRTIQFGKFADKMVIGSSLGYTFGRLGNFTNGELYGRITAKPWGMIFPQAESLPIADPRVEAIAQQVGLDANPLGLVNLPRHPSQLYEAFFEGIFAWFILVLLYKFISPTKKYAHGMFAAIYIILYGLARFFIEYFRQPDVGLDFVAKFSNLPNPRWALVSPLNFTTGQVFSSIMILIGGITLVLLYWHHGVKQKRQKIIS